MFLFNYLVLINIQKTQISANSSKSRPSRLITGGVVGWV
jgi:hypothetical protein